MAVARVSSDGQVTIPESIRKRFEISAGDVLVFVDVGGCLQLRVVRQRKLTDFYGIFPSGLPPMSMDEMRDLVGHEIGRQLLNGGHE